eukprot:snap_masked-scaffold_13-processed-gene-5.22-mRNA-1 protein AED:1.00 eAED:1.00 QI:0/0/0/0/1/1/3/0/59
MDVPYFGDILRWREKNKIEKYIPILKYNKFKDQLLTVVLKKSPIISNIYLSKRNKKNII